MSCRSVKKRRFTSTRWPRSRRSSDPMPATFPTMPVLALSIDGLKPFATDLWEHMHHAEWWAATTFWGVIWACGFVATFLLLRVLFTRWGDRDVMKKTLAVSLLLHLLCGMLSTRVVFGPAGASQGLLSLILPGSSREDSTKDVSEEDPRIDEVAIEGPDSPGDDLAGSENAAGGKLPGASPPWERTPSFSSQVPARMENQPREPAEAAIAQPQRTGGGEALSFPSGDQTDRPAHADPFPEPDRQTARMSRPSETPQTRIAEETADARPEAGTPPGARAARSAAGEIGAPEITPRTRPAETKNSAAAIDYGPDLVESSKSSEPRPALARGADTREVPRMSRGNPKSNTSADSPGDEAATAAGAVPGASGGRSAARIGRPSGSPPGSGTLAGPRLGTPGPGGSDRPAGSGTGIGSSPGGGVADGVVASRSPGGNPSGDGLVPGVVRSEIEGAIGKNGGKVPATYRLRTSPARKKIAIDMGANEDSERAVETSLKWLADHQHANRSEEHTSELQSLR